MRVELPVVWDAIDCTGTEGCAQMQQQAPLTKVSTSDPRLRPRSQQEGQLIEVADQAGQPNSTSAPCVTNRSPMACIVRAQHGTQEVGVVGKGMLEHKA